jgi:hypothetical protein
LNWHYIYKDRDCHSSEKFQIKTAHNSINILCGVGFDILKIGVYEEFWDPRIRWKSADNSEEHIASIFTVDKYANKETSTKQVLPIRRSIFTELHGIIYLRR